jgi:hypothetical protein
LTTNIFLEEYFGGSLIGDISSFRMYIEPLNAAQIKHNFDVLKTRYKLLNPFCPSCITYLTPTPTPTNTMTPTNTPTITNTQTNTQTLTPTQTNTPTITNTQTTTPTPTITDTPTSTPTQTTTNTPTNTSTLTVTPTNTSTLTVTPTKSRFVFLVHTGITSEDACKEFSNIITIYGDNINFDENILFYNNQIGPTNTNM